jgi:hypothetical protein
MALGLNACYSAQTRGTRDGGGGARRFGPRGRRTEPRSNAALGFALIDLTSLRLVRRRNRSRRIRRGQINAVTSGRNLLAGAAAADAKRPLRGL